MLKLTVKAGEYLMIGDQIKVVFTGGSSNNLHVLVDAPRSFNIARSNSLEKKGVAGLKKHYKDRDISPEAKAKIKAILMEDRKKTQHAVSS